MAQALKTEDAFPRQSTGRNKRSANAPDRSGATIVLIPVPTEPVIRMSVPAYESLRSTMICKPGTIQIKSVPRTSFKVQYTPNIPPPPIPMKTIGENLWSSCSSTETTPDANRSSAMTTAGDNNPPPRRGNTNWGRRSFPRISRRRRYSVTRVTRRHRLLHAEILAKETTWLSLILLLVSGIGCGIICLYMFSKNGRAYYIDVGAVSAIANVILGILGLRAGRWKRLPNYFCASGYFLLLSSLNFIQFCVLGLLATLWHPSKPAPRVYVAAGFVCSLSLAALFLALFALCAFIWRKASNNRIYFVV